MCTTESDMAEVDPASEEPKVVGGGGGGESTTKKAEKGQAKSAPVSFDREDDKWTGGDDGGGRSSRGKVLKQSSLDVEFMARERLQANVEMRKKIQKQHSLPAEPQRSVGHE